jgi:hypothetical protein
MAVKKLKDIYPGYFQKSRVFLFPALGIKPSSNTPIETYIMWEDFIAEGEMKLLVKYHLRDDQEFTTFEERYLLGNKFFDDYKELPDGKATYIFNLNPFEDDWISFMAGKYSLISEPLKKAIRDYYGVNTANYAFIHSYLNPSQYFVQYAEFLCPDPLDRPEMVSMLRSVGELCDKPNLQKEQLKVGVKSLDFNNL